MKHILLIGFCLLGFETAFGQGSRKPVMETDRPSKAESPYVVPEGNIQVETGFTMVRDRAFGRNFTTLHFPEADFRIGVLKRLELRAHAEIFRSSARLLEKVTTTTETGISNTGLGFKYHFRDTDLNTPAIALLGNVTLPVGSKAYNARVIEPELKLIFTNKINEDLSFNYTIGFKLEDANPSELGDQKYNRKPSYAVNLNNKFTPKLQAFIEFFGEKNEGERFQHSTDAGLAYQLKPNLQLDLVAGVGLQENAPDFLISTGISFRLPD